MTEFWRGRRKCAGVLHFCGLGYSRPDGQTSDNFIDLESLRYEPQFYRYVRDAFSPVGLMLDFWQEQLPAGPAPIELPVVVINDLDKPWQGRLVVKLLFQKQTSWQQEKELSVAPRGTTTATFSLDVPSVPGNYRLVAELHDVDGATVRSLRDFKLTPAD